MELFPPFFSLSVSLSLSCPNEQVSRETRHNKKRHDATLCLQHKARVLPARKLSRRNPPRRRDGASSSTRVVFGARILSLPFFRLLHFCALQIGKMSLSGGTMVRISSRPESARARLFSRVVVVVAWWRGREKERSRRVGADRRYSRRSFSSSSSR